MRTVQCHNCGSTSRHLVPTLERIIQLQSVTTGDDLFVNYACPQCSTLTRSLVDSGAKFFAGVDLSKFPDDMTEFGVLLGCASPNCESPVILLAPIPSTVDLDQLTQHIGTNWKTNGACCLKGFPPAQPFEIRMARPL